MDKLREQIRSIFKVFYDMADGLDEYEDFEEEIMKATNQIHTLYKKKWLEMVGSDEVMREYSEFEDINLVDAEYDELVARNKLRAELRKNITKEL